MVADLTGNILLVIRATNARLEYRRITQAVKLNIYYIIISIGVISFGGVAYEYDILRRDIRVGLINERTRVPLYYYYYY